MVEVPKVAQMAQDIKVPTMITYIQMDPSTSVDKIDPYKNREKYLRLKRQFLEGHLNIPSSAGKLLFAFLDDMEKGINLSSNYKKGSRSYIRIVAAFSRLKSLFNLFQQQGIDDITKLKEEDIVSLLSKIEHGEIRKADGKVYRCSKDFLCDLKVFWHWYMRINKKNKINIEDITQHISVRPHKPNFVYFTLDDLLNFIFPELNFEEKTLCLFLFDTIMRAPTEVSNIRVSDIYNDFKEVKIRDEVSKTYGRTVTLHLSSEMLKTYIETKCLQPTDYVFKFSYDYFRRKLQKIAKKKFGTTMTKGGEPYSHLSLYDFRHSGAIHWRLTKYKNNIDALMYRGGWSNLEMLNYYTRVIGMSDIKTTEFEQQQQSSSLDQQSLYRLIEKQSSQIEQLTAMLIRQQALPNL